MEFLREVLGDGYTAFEESIKTWNEKPENKDNPINIANIGTGGYVKQSEYDTLKAANRDLEDQLQSAANTLKEFEGVDAKELEGKINSLKTDMANQKADYEKRIADMQFNSVLESAITTSGGRNTKAIKALLDVDALRESKEQSSDIKAAIEACQKENEYLFGENEPIHHPVGQTGGTLSSIDSNIKTLRASMGLPIEATEK